MSTSSPENHPQTTTPDYKMNPYSAPKSAELSQNHGSSQSYPGCRIVVRLVGVAHVLLALFGLILVMEFVKGGFQEWGYSYNIQNHHPQLASELATKAVLYLVGSFVIFLLVVFNFVVGLALWKFRAWSRWAATAQAAGLSIIIAVLAAIFTGFRLVNGGLEMLILFPLPGLFTGLLWLPRTRVFSLGGRGPFSKEVSTPSEP